MQVTHKPKARTSFQEMPITMTLARMLTRFTSDRFQPRAAEGPEPRMPNDTLWLEFRADRSLEPMCRP
jgi:hypothetical protein